MASNLAAKKILILKLGAIGDVVMALSMINAIREEFGETKVTWICGKTVLPLLERVIGIDRIIVIDDKKLYTGSLFQKLFQVLDLWRKVFLDHYDIVFNGYRNKLYKHLLLPVLSKMYIDFSGSGDKTFLKECYHSDEYCRVLLGKDSSHTKNYGFPSLQIENIAEPKTELSKDRVILAPGGAKNILRDDALRRWQIENYFQTAKQLLEYGYKVSIIGSETDNWVNEYFYNLEIENLVGKKNLIELIQLFNNSNLLITHDTGVLHLAKLSQIKIIALFGPVNWKERVSPKENVDVIWQGKELSCSPCYDGINFAKCYNNLCMKNISVELVISKVLHYSKNNFGKNPSITVN
ncbi:MAG: glycosyl transferase family protein [Ignavibacteria bacterium]|nr:MAG: glycosyl transferase family protein [Ignavibacteria bacterium]KAF0161225.1 MAG: glycosyl transferase family protein [Ignavibacteria bacterium]